MLDKKEYTNSINTPLSTIITKIKRLKEDEPVRFLSCLFKSDLPTSTLAKTRDIRK